MNELIAKFEELKLRVDIDAGKTRLKDTFNRIKDIIKGILSDTSDIN